MNERDLNDIQGLILRGYRKDAACHLVLRIEELGQFKALLGNLADEDLRTGPFVTVAADWTDKPPAGQPAHVCLNLGFTHAGLEAVGVSPDSLITFPEAFRAGAAARAEAFAGETGGNAPDRWSTQLGSEDAHVILSAYADTRAELDALVQEVVAATAECAVELERFPAHRLDGQDVEHFGYADGLSQPTIDGLEPRVGLKDPFPPVPPGEFVLGHPAQSGHPWEPPPDPEELGRNGSFAAFRVMAQDVPAFRAFLETESARSGLDGELLAAKLCGRWRNGEPLALRPADAPADGVSESERNMFDYEATAADILGDREGRGCPRGAHIRRAFPRSQRVVDDFDGFQRRIVRRGMPYGPAFDPEHPTDERRGLVGHFICASLANQYEYVMLQWLNDGIFTGGRLGRSKDPLTGANDPETSRFKIPGTPDLTLTGFPQFVTTRGCAYVFLPSMRSLRYLAALP